jgi:cytosine/adenosine deaminase-related metal-dependent hydrolase
MGPTSFVLSDLRIFTGTELIESGHVVVKNGIISSVSAGPPPVDVSTTVFSKPGHTVVPGFIDAHIHADKGQEIALYQSLKFGITTVMDMHNETVNVHKLKKLAAENRDEAADFKAAGMAATIEGGWPMPVVTAHDKSEEVSLIAHKLNSLLISSPLIFYYADGCGSRYLAETYLPRRCRSLRCAQSFARRWRRLYKVDA